MKTLFAKTLFALFFFFVCILSDEKENVVYRFKEDDTYYSFLGSITMKADFDCIMQLIFEFEHISKYSMGAKSMQVNQRGKDWYDVTYVYQKMLMFENKSTWRRTLMRDEGKVVFEMLSSENNVEIMPNSESSSGYYQIKVIDGYYKVEYFQECTLRKNVFNKRYKQRLKKNAIKFLYVLKKYIQDNCR